MEECEGIRMLILDGVRGEHDAVPYQSAGERPAEYDRKSAQARTIMRDPIDGFLAQRPLMILDGALATELERRGADLRDPLWSAKCVIEQPDLIRAVHLDYFHAGADVATTATYQATFEGFARRGIEGARAAQLMRDAVALAVAAAARLWAVRASPPVPSRPLLLASSFPSC